MTPTKKDEYMRGYHDGFKDGSRSLQGAQAKSEPIALTSLVGKHILDAVDFNNEPHKEEWREEFEDCQVCRFRLDGVVYIAREDPSDGYRSSMRDLHVSENAAVVNAFQPIEVLAVYKDKRDYRDTDILQLLDTANGKLVLEVGTDNTDDYYPSFVANFSPENMAINAGAAP